MFGVCAMRDFSGYFARVGKAVKQIGESLRMHEAMLDRGFQHFQHLRMPFAGVFESGFDCGVKLIAQAGVVAVHFPASRPVERAIGGEAAADRIDAKRKKLIERRIKGAQPERAASEKIPVESLDMAEIENEAVPLRNRPVVKRFLADQRKNFVGAGTRAHQTGLKIVANANSGRSSHELSPSLDASFARRFRRKTNAGRLCYGTMFTLRVEGVNRNECERRKPQRGYHCVSRR